MEWLWNIFLSLLGLYGLFILLMALIFILIADTSSSTSKRDRSLLLWILAAVVLIGSALSLFTFGDFFGDSSGDFFGDFKEIASWLFIGLFFLSFIGFLFSKEKYEKSNGIEPWNPHWVPKFDTNEDKNVDVDQDKKNSEE